MAKRKRRKAKTTVRAWESRFGEWVATACKVDVDGVTYCATGGGSARSTATRKARRSLQTTLRDFGVVK